MSRPLLHVEGLSKHFGGVAALDDVSLDVGAGELVGLIGPNGAGKTTLFNCITGIFRPEAGAIRFGRQAAESDQLVGLAPHEIAQRGIARTFQNIRLFRALSVLENVLVGTFSRTHTGVIGAALTTPEARREEHWAHDRAMELLEFVSLADRAEDPAASLAFGWQRRLEIARALASDPALLLLDEPGAGLNPVEKQQLLQLLDQLRSRGIAMLLIEHDMQVVMPVSRRVFVLDYGRVIAHGTPQEVQADPRVIEAYLGAPPS